MVPPRDFLPLEGEQVTFQAFDGLGLKGMIVRPPSDRPAKGMIVFGHEFTSDMYSCARYCRQLVEAGYDIFSFDFRGHGASSKEKGYTPRQWATDREVADLMGAIAFIEDWLEEQGRPREVGLFGISRGACANVLAAVHNPAVRAICCDSVFSSDRILEYLIKRWASIFAKIRVVYQNHHPAFWAFLRWLLLRIAGWEMKCEFPSVRKALMRMPPRPILFVHGETDSYIPLRQAEILYNLAPQPKYFLRIPGAKHNQSAMIDPERYKRWTVSFFDRYLAGEISEDDLTQEMSPQVPPSRLTEFEDPASVASMN
jgi:pimeloyl-ACP methyl ester carboxylesterase